MAINLQKGQRINLEKSSGAKLTQFCVGVNWGAIEYQVEEGGFLGFGKKNSNQNQRCRLGSKLCNV